MKYLIVQDWQNTHGNHAGMSHMCDMLVDRWPNEYKKILKNEPIPLKVRGNWFTRKFYVRYDMLRSKGYGSKSIWHYVNLCLMSSKKEMKCSY